MARTTGRKCAICRREGIKLYLKGSRCETAKCAVERRPKPPGAHGDRRIRQTDYGVHLREKQKAKRWYGVLERQFRQYFEKALGMPGNTGQNLLILLERRLDNVLCRFGFTPSRSHARQMIRHGHVLIDGKRVTIPSWQVEAGNKVTFVGKEKTQKMVKEGLESPKKDLLPSWLQRTENPPEGVVVALPSREEVPVAIKEQLIVELCSK